jgi:hypothetical protein
MRLVLLIRQTLPEGAPPGNGIAHGIGPAANEVIVVNTVGSFGQWVRERNHKERLDMSGWGGRSVDLYCFEIIYASVAERTSKYLKG